MQKQELLQNLKSSTKYFQSRIDENKAKLIENYCYYLSWVGEELWIDTFMVEHYNKIINEIEEGEHPSIEVIEHWVKRSQNFISESYNVRENSTGALHRECSTWKFIAHMNLIKSIKSLID